MSERHAIIEWKSGQQAILTSTGWRVIPRDDILSELLNREYSLAETQRRRETLTPDLLGCAARGAASALGAEDLKIVSPALVT